MKIPESFKGRESSDSVKHLLVDVILNTQRSSFKYKKICLTFFCSPVLAFHAPIKDEERK